MEKRLRGALRSSAEGFIAEALVESVSKKIKPALKTVIWAIPASSPLCSTLPAALRRAVSCLLDSFRSSLESQPPKGPDVSPRSTPTGRARTRQKSPSPPKGKAVPASDYQDETLKQLRGLRICAWIAHLCVSHPKKRFTAEDLVPCVRSLHDCLVLFEMDEGLLSEVAGLCERWWKEKLPEREILISQSLPYLLSRSLTRNKKADVHRVYALRDAFNLFDFMDGSIEDLRLLLVRCVITPLYLKTEEGRKFVAFTLGLNGQLLKEALALIKSQIPFGRKTVLEAYGDIVFRAWKCSEGTPREEIEDDFLQGLVEGAIYANSRPLAASIRRVLGTFLENRATDGVDKLLFRLVEPIIFRSLQVTNSNVRHNALHLLIAMFPLEDPEVTREVKNVLLDKQLFLLERLLVDDSSDVRAVAVEGCCRILHMYWEVIPSPTITRILRKVIDDLSRDLVNDVKLSTLNGITYLLGNPQAHEILKVLVPRLGYMFLDPLLSVRLAVCDLLLAVRDMRNFQFNKVVSLDVLLSSLASDHLLVARKITRLLMSSYFPSKLGMKEACSRFVTLVKRSPAAAARFCEFALLEGSSTKSLVELLRVCFSLAISPKELQHNQIDALFIASANLCDSLSSDTSLRAALGKYFPKRKLKSLLSTTSSLRAQNSILSIASFVFPDDLGDFHDECMRLITSCIGISDNVEIQNEVRRVHKLMLSNGWFDDLFGALAGILQASASQLIKEFGIEAKTPAVASKRKRRMLTRKPPKSVDGSNKKESSDFPEENYALDVPAAAAAWQVKDLLSNPESRDALLNSSHLGSVSLSLHTISSASIEQCNRWELDMSPILAFTSLSLYMSLQNIESTNNGDLRSGSKRPTLEGSTLEESLNKLLDSAEKLFSNANLDTFCKTPLKVNQVEKSACSKLRKKEARAGVKPEDSFLGGKLISNIIQISATLLRFIVDSATLKLIPIGKQKWIHFASSFARYIILTMRKHQASEISIQSLKENIFCIKSAFSYAAKLLHLVISGYDQTLHVLPEISTLANNLLDLIASMELHLGSGCASSIISVAKHWLPDLVLGFCSGQLANEGQVEDCAAADGNPSFNPPLWLVLLSKIELCELRECNEDEEGNRYPDPMGFVFKKLIAAFVLLLKRGNIKVLEAVGIAFLTFIKVGLEAEDFNLVLGLVHFVCVKLVGEDGLAWSEFEVVNNCLQKSYAHIETALTDMDPDENGRQMLEIAKQLLNSHGKDPAHS